MINILRVNNIKELFINPFSFRYKKINYNLIKYKGEEVSDKSRSMDTRKINMLIDLNSS